jgi:hypothetical protein
VQRAARALIIELTLSALDFSELNTTARRWVQRNENAHLHIGHSSFLIQRVH